MMSEKRPKIGFYGGARSVTGSNFLFESSEGVRVLIDCGLFQGEQMCDRKNFSDFKYDPKSIDALFVTHAHLDHIGRIPLLVKAGFKGVIYSTPPTKDIAELLLEDSLNVLEREARQNGVKSPYSKNDVSEALILWKTKNYHEQIEIGGDLSIKLKDSGHILGSAMVEITNKGLKTLFTGDLGNSPAPLLHDTEIIGDADYVVMESVYGDRNHEDREERRKILRSTVIKAIEKGGTLMIPAFSIERTQDLLFELNNLVENKKIPPVPIFLDSPLAIRVTSVYKKYENYFNQNAKDVIKSGDDIFKFPGLKFTNNTDQSIAIKEHIGPKIIIAGAGMSNGGRIRRHEELYLGDPKNTLLIVGYQAPETLGRNLAEGAKEVNIENKIVSVSAEILNLRGYSAHKDSDGLLEFITTINKPPKKIFIVLGEPKASIFLAQKISDNLGFRTTVPEEGEEVVL